MSRTNEVNYIDNVAVMLTSQKITEADYPSVEAFIEDAVQWHINNSELPDWWDAHDTALLRRLVTHYVTP